MSAATSGTVPPPNPPRDTTPSRPLWRNLLGFNALTALVLGIAGYALGHWVGSRIAIGLDSQTVTDQDDIAIFMGFVFAVLGWLAGLGFLNYPLSRMLGRSPALREHEEEGPGRYFRLCTDHKVVGLQYFVTVLLFFFIAGLNAMFIRAELMTPNESLWKPGQYLSLVGLHGTMMLIMMSAAVLGPFGNYLVPIMIGARRMAFPRLEALELLARAGGGADPAVGDRLRRLPHRLDRLRAAEQRGRRRHGRLHHGVRAHRPLDDDRGREHARDGAHDARPRAHVEPAADLRLGGAVHLRADGPRGAGAVRDARHGRPGPHRRHLVLPGQRRRQPVALGNQHLQPGRSVVGDQPSVVDQRDPIAQPVRLVEVVRGEHDRRGHGCRGAPR